MSSTPNASTPRYSDFLVVTHVAVHTKVLFFSVPGAPRREVHWYRSETPIPWVEARDRLIAAGVLGPKLGGRRDLSGGWFLSVDSFEIELHKWKQLDPIPLPLGEGKNQVDGAQSPVEVS